MKDFQTLKVWIKAHQGCLAVYKSMIPFPKDELYGLTSQLRRAAVSIPANIAEGCGHGSGADFARSLQIAMGSTSELEYELLLVRDPGHLSSEEHLTLDQTITEIKQMLASFLKKLKADR